MEESISGSSGAARGRGGGSRWGPTDGWGDRRSPAPQGLGQILHLRSSCSYLRTALSHRAHHEEELQQERGRIKHFGGLLAAPLPPPPPGLGLQVPAATFAFCAAPEVGWAAPSCPTATPQERHPIPPNQTQNYPWPRALSWVPKQRLCWAQPRPWWEGTAKPKPNPPTNQTLQTPPPPLRAQTCKGERGSVPSRGRRSSATSFHSPGALAVMDPDPPLPKCATKPPGAAQTRHRKAAEPRAVPAACCRTAPTWGGAVLVSSGLCSCHRGRAHVIGAATPPRQPRANDGDPPRAEPQSELQEEPLLSPRRHVQRCHLPAGLRLGRSTRGARRLGALLALPHSSGAPRAVLACCRNICMESWLMTAPAAAWPRMIFSGLAAKPGLGWEAAGSGAGGGAGSGG